MDRFEELQNEVFAMHAEGRYEKAATMLEEVHLGYPYHDQRIYFWRICFNALAGNRQEALRVFGEAVEEKDHWFGKGLLRGDADLESLQGDPEFERLFAICEERQLEAEGKVEPHRVDILPRGEGPYPLLIALHGNGANAEVAAPRWRAAVREGWLVTAPQAMQVSGEDAYVWADEDLALREVRRHIKEVLAAHDASGDRILAGFSGGGKRAIELTLNGEVGADAFIAVAPSIREEDVEALKPHIQMASERGLRGYILVGDQDVAAVPASKELYRLMVGYGAPCKMRIYEGMGHIYPPDLSSVLPGILEYLSED